MMSVLVALAIGEREDVANVGVRGPRDNAPALVALECLGQIPVSNAGLHLDPKGNFTFARSAWLHRRSVRITRLLNSGNPGAYGR